MGDSTPPGHSTLRPLGDDDLAWAVQVLAERRARLQPYAPVYWRPAPDATARHAEWLGHVLGDGGGVGFRTDDALMIATPSRSGWTIDDAWVPPSAWYDDGLALWERVRSEIGWGLITFVCPVPEIERSEFVLDRGLTISSSWWHLDVPLERATQGEASVTIAGAAASLAPAPPVYDPGGPVTFLQDVRDLSALTLAAEEAARVGSPLVVVDQPPGRSDLVAELGRQGFVRHCDFWTTD